MKLVCLLLCCLSSWAQIPVRSARPTVVLVALEGFGWDDARRAGAVNLQAMAARGASAPEGMLPAYPAQTEPNLYTLATGLYPEHHGVVADSFYDGARRYEAGDPSALENGTPLWALAERQGLRAANMGWPGPGSPVLSAKRDLTDAARVQQVLAWLRLPESSRPRFITLALEEVERAGRASGPESPQTRAAVRQADALVGRLRVLRPPVDLVVVSDHGIVRTEGGWLDLDKDTPLTGFATAGALLYAPGEAEAQQAYERLRSADAGFKVYRRADVPRELRFRANARAGDPVIVPARPVAVRAHGGAGPPGAGSDGYDPRQVPAMKAVFYAEGPGIRPGVKLKPFENVNVYPFLAELLGLDAPKTDGSAGVLAPALAQTTSEPPR